MHLFLNALKRILASVFSNPGLYKTNDNCQAKFMDVLQETRRYKIEQVTRFCHKLIRDVRDFIEVEDLDLWAILS
jgi:hypothetical protein